MWKNKEYTTKFIVMNASSKLIGQSVFPNITSHDPDLFVCHSIELAKAVMEKYSDTRLRFLTKKPDPQKCVRHIYSKLIHFKNQCNTWITNIISFKSENLWNKSDH